MPLMIGYQMVASATNKTEDEVREDKKNGLIDLDSLPSMVEYIARAWGWVPPEEIVARSVAPVVPPEKEPERIYAGTRNVRDNVKPTDDPYLARVKRERGA